MFSIFKKNTVSNPYCYLVTWITPHLGVGHAPMSFSELDEIRMQGVTAIVNLCEEFCDLHELEAQAGFEVFYLPTTDEHPPESEKLEEALEWLDEAIYLGKRVLIHCKHGVGRTGTFVMAYLLRRGFTLRNAEKLLKKTKTRANPTNFSQWGMLKKFGRKEGQLKHGTPRAENRNSFDLSEFYIRYEDIQQKVGELTQAGAQQNYEGRCCKSTFSLSPIEAIYFNERVNISLSAAQRQNVLTRAASLESCCPLFQDGNCMLHDFRPIRCRVYGVEYPEEKQVEITNELNTLSTRILAALFEQRIHSTPPLVARNDVISGKFIENYFTFLASQLTSS